MEKKYLHADLDAFFASVEQLDHPEYRGKPVIVSGLPGDRRCVVSTASYEARKYGIHSAMPAKTAFQLCPEGIFVRPNMRRYHEKSEEVMSIFRQYSPDVLQMSVDEAFIDLTGTERLLGPAEETARKIKKQVFEETGLTISIGLASTMYLAKIASGYRKPDGLTVIKEGDEEKFMLSLPVDKLWGCGKKTLEHIRNAGFKTTQSIYDKSERLLQSIFGENTGSYLYNSVRGNKGLIFGNVAGYHSISSERTFPFDLTDRDAIETSLLELAHTVMFRLHRENCHSRTVSLKIRYEDFTTVSIQETGERNFTSVDDLFERCVRLFYKKYDNSSGIRLLGVSADKVEDNSVPSQIELFDFGEEKKSKVEKAIVKLEDKMPGVKIHKARTLHNAFALFAAGLLFSVFSIKQINAQEITFDKSAVSLFSYSDDKKGFEITSKGFWESQILSSTSFSFGYGNIFSSLFSTPVFTNTVDLSIEALLNKHIYFDGIFTDGFNKNTIAAGYKSDGLVRHFRAANRGILFPDTYSVSKSGYSIGGGNNESPGFLLHLETEKLISDTVLRYDSLTQKSITYFGTNAVVSTKISLSDFICGRQFVLPSAKDVADIDCVYVENIYGNYTDSEGRKYKKLSTADFTCITSRNLLVLSKEAGSGKQNGINPCVLVTFKSVTKSAFILEAGSYDDGISFLGKIQKYFSENNSSYNDIQLSKYSYDLFTVIDSKDALILQKGSYFSPFEICCTYDAGIITTAEALVTDSLTERVIPDYSVSVSQNDEFHLWLTVKNSSEEDYTLPQVRYPLAQDDPSFYIHTQTVIPYTLDLRSYTPVSVYSIGTDAAEGTVAVYINDIPDTGAKYSSSTGIVTLSKNAGERDKIYITWSEDNPLSSNGALAFASSIKYFFTKTFSTDLNISAKWSLPFTQNFATSETEYPGFASIVSGLEYNTENFSISNTLSTALVNENTSGLYRLLSMDDASEKQNFLSRDSGYFLKENTAPAINARDYDFSEKLIPQNNMGTGIHKAVTDTNVEGFIIPLEWNYSLPETTSSSDKNWAAVNIDLGSYSENLSGAELFNIALSGTNITPGTKIYLQLGIPDNDSIFFEDSSNIPTWLISKTSSEQNAQDVIYSFATDFSSQNETKIIPGTKVLGGTWQQVTVKLNDFDRLRLTEFSNARIIAVAENISTHGIIYAGPWSYYGNSFSSSYDSSFVQIYSMQYSSSANEGSIINNNITETFNSRSQNTIQSFRWNVISQEELFTDEQNIISFGKYFDAASFDSYRYINFFFKYNPSGKKECSSSYSLKDYSIMFELDRISSGLPSEKAVSLKITSQEAEKLSGDKWHKAVIDTYSGRVTVDGTTLTAENHSLYINRKTVPTHITLSLNLYSEKNSSLYTSGIFEIDELYFSESETNLNAKDNLSITYFRPESILKAGNIEFLGNVSFTVNAEGQTVNSINSDKERSFSSIGNASLSFSSLNLDYDFGAGASFSSEENKQATLYSKGTNADGLTLAHYSVKTKNPFGKILSLSTDFSTNNSSATDSTSSQAVISFSQFNVPLTIQAKTGSTSSLWSSTQNASAQIDFNSKYYLFNVTSNFTQQRTPSYSFTDNIISSFKDIQALAFSTGFTNSNLRTEKISIKNTFNFFNSNFSPAVTVTENITAEKEFKNSFDILCELPVKFSSQKITLGAESFFTENFSLPQFTSSESAYISDIKFILSNNDIPSLKTDTYTGFLTWTKSLYNSPLDIYVPTGASLSVSKETLSSASVSQYYLVKGQLSYTALNVFGKFGTDRIFDWYEQEFYSSSFSVSFKIPETEAEQMSFILTGYLNTDFYLQKEDILQVIMNASYEQNANANAGVSLLWKRGVSSSPLILFASLFKPELKQKHFNLTRINSLLYSFARTSETTVTSSQVFTINTISLSHELSAAINRYFTLKGNLTGSYMINAEKYNSISLKASICGRVEF